MWSDRTPPARLAALVNKLHSVLPAPLPTASSAQTKLSGQATPQQVAELLQREAGFAFMNRSANDGNPAPNLFHKPLATISYSASAKTAVVSGPSETVEVAGAAFEILEAVLAAWHGPAGALLVGFLSYDLAAEIEDLGPLPPLDFQFPSLYFGLFDSVLTYDGGAWNLTTTNAWRDQAVSEWEDVLRRAAQIEPQNVPITARSLSSQPDRATFESAVKRIVANIHAGDIFQTNLCRRIVVDNDVDADAAADFAWPLFQRMRAINPSRYEAFLRVGDGRSILSISPEMFLRMDSGVVESSPIKGTRPRGRNSAEDDELSSELLASEKDRAELAMIVDVTRNDLSRVCQAGSIEVSKHAELMTLPTVHHLFSTVKGRLRAGAEIVELLRASFPAASITGAPKIEAIRIAMREENQWRGPCMGAIGWISLDGQLELSVAIRTAFVEDRRVHYYAGCGITSDSVPAKEFAESRHKAAAFVRALGLEHDPNW